MLRKLFSSLLEIRILQLTPLPIRYAHTELISRRYTLYVSSTRKSTPNISNAFGNVYISPRFARRIIVVVEDAGGVEPENALVVPPQQQKISPP